VTLYQFILAEKARFEVRVMCDVFGIAPSRYYEWERKQQSEHATKDAELLASIRAIFAKFRGRYGAPRIHDQLARQEVCVSQKRVARLMREAGLKAKGRRKYKATTDSNHGAPVAPNVLERDFHVERPDAAWVSDITYIWTRQGWMYLAVILDLYSRKVVGWSLADRMTAELVCDALDAAVRLRRPKPGLIFHSDRGSQYASRAFRRRLWRHQMRQSMSRKGDCWDNAVAESFFATLKKELIRDRAIDTREHTRAEVFEYIEVFYNRQRAHSLLNYETPDAFEICFEKENAA
jgi:putative transposase